VRRGGEDGSTNCCNAEFSDTFLARPTHRMWSTSRSPQLFGVSRPPAPSGGPAWSALAPCRYLGAEAALQVRRSRHPSIPDAPHWQVTGGT